jgi:thymidylate synthase
MKLIVAVDQHMGIGYNSKLPWNDKEELKLFREITLGYTLVLGRKTIESLPKLKDRTLICLTKNEDLDTSNFNNDVILLNDLPEKDENTFIAGGHHIYKKAFETDDYIDEIFISILKQTYDSDTFFDKKWLDNFVIVEEKNFNTFDHYRMIRANNGERQYLNLLEKVLKGQFRDTRNGVTISSFGNQLTFNLQDGFPLLTTKKMFLRGIVEEFLFFMRGDTDSTYLSNKKVKIWEGNTSEEFIEKCGLNYAKGVMGPMYGYQWRKFNAPYRIDENGRPIASENEGIDQIKEVIHLINNDPHSRRILLTTYNPSQAKEGVLFPCHSITIQFYVENKFLDMFCYNRSQDVFLGTPFNIASSSLLLHVISKLTNKIPRNFIMSMGDTHIYTEHIENVTTQIKRLPYKFPNIKIPEINKLEDINQLEAKDFILENYSSHPSIKAKMIA